MGWRRGVKRESVKVEQVEENAEATTVTDGKKTLRFLFSPILQRLSNDKRNMTNMPVFQIFVILFEFFI